MGSILVLQADPSGAWGEALEAAGHATQVVTRVRDAMHLVKDGGIEVIVIDALDPRVGVADLANEIAELPEAPPIILISSSPYAPSISVRIGAAAFLPKPLDVAELIALVARMATHTRPVLLVDLEDEPTTEHHSVGKIHAS